MDINEAKNAPTEQKLQQPNNKNSNIRIFVIKTTYTHTHTNIQIDRVNNKMQFSNMQQI